MNKQDIDQKIQDIEQQMNLPEFWQDKVRAQETISEYERLKDELAGVGKYDRGNAVINILAGAGGDDAEDFAGMLYRMYMKFAEKKGWILNVLNKNSNDKNGFRNISLEMVGKSAYKDMQHESGVHRLVRLSPFNSNNKRHTSFAMVEVMPVMADKDVSHINLPEKDLEVAFARSSGPGGQNVNKRDTAVRMVHVPTGISVHVESERSQESNRDKARTMIKSRLAQLLEDQKIKELGDLRVSATTNNEWGSQIRSYVLHPYQLVKDHRTDIEVRDTDSILEDGKIDVFIKAMQDR